MDTFFFFFLNFLLFSYSCPAFFPMFFSAISPPPHSKSPLPLSVPMSPLFEFLGLSLPLLSPVIPRLPPLWSLSVCSLFPSLWFYFANLFVLLIWFHLQLRYSCFLTLNPVKFPSYLHILIEIITHNKWSVFLQFSFSQLYKQVFLSFIIYWPIGAYLFSACLSCVSHPFCTVPP